ncbi:MAG TPA: RusA family crossover junction endodeoxyribonuclease [Chloroflexi bacterium]|nr:RusA family crossover junction endodeoxyribonuclease [Chloroflexota bacterium]HPO58187.1 hypothetical protein [Anaerolineaceae bacterium]
MDLFIRPDGLTLIAHFTLPWVQTWGDSRKDSPYKAWVRETAALPSDFGARYNWFAFSIRAVVARSRVRFTGQIPDVENIPKLIVDAFTGVLYPDDDIRYVRGVQVEAVISPDEENLTEVWIYGMPAGGVEAGSEPPGHQRQ